MASPSMVVSPWCASWFEGYKQALVAAEYIRTIKQKVRCLAQNDRVELLVSFRGCVIGETQITFMLQVRITSSKQHRAEEGKHLMASQIYMNLPVKDLKRSNAFP
jgi:hypothetical protein